MRAIRDVQTGWLHSWWDAPEEAGENVIEPEPDANAGQELIEIEQTSDEFVAGLKAESGLEEIAGAYIEEIGEPSATLAKPEPSKAGKGPRKIPPGRAKAKAEPIGLRDIEVGFPVLAAMVEYATLQGRRDNQNMTWGDLKEISRLVAERKIGGVDDGSAGT